MLRRLLLAVILLGSLAPSADTRSIHGAVATTPPGSFTPAWQDVKIGAGGLLSSVHRSNSDDTILVRTDTYGGYLYKTSGTCTPANGGTVAAPCYEQLFTSLSLPAAFVDLQTASNSSNLGVAELVSCNSNTNVFYTIFLNTVLVSTNRGATWVATPQTTSQNANTGPKSTGKFIACDPNNPDIMYVGTNTALRKTSNGTAGGSATFSTVSTVGTTGGVPSIIAYDPASSVSGGVTQHFWVLTQSTGVYETSDGGTTFTLRNTTGMPTIGRDMHADKFSQLLVVDASALIYKYVNGSGWTTKNANSDFYGVYADPSSASLGTNKIIANTSAGRLSISTDNGATFSDPFFPETATYTASGAQPGWINVASQGAAPNTSSWKLVINSSGRVIMTGGIAMWSISSPAADVALVFAADTVGIEQLVSNQITSPPNGSTLFAGWDRGVYRLLNPDSFPTVQYPNSTSIEQIEGAWGIDYAAGTVGFATSLIQSNISTDNSPAKTTNGGLTWTQWVSNPTGMNAGGVIAASSPTNWQVIPNASGGAFQFTTNGATSWSPSTMGTGCTGSFVTSFFNNRQPLAADRVTAGKFYAIDTAQNVCVSTDSGANFAKVASTCCDGTPYRDTLKTMPGSAGTLFFTTGIQFGAGPDNTHLWKSSNSAVTWASVDANLKEVLTFGFGAALPSGGGLPVIYAYGYYNSVQGVFQSNDGGSTWAAINAPAGISTWPGRSVDLAQDMTGDQEIYGRIYVCYLGSSCTYIDTADACPWINFTNIVPNQALTGASVTLTAHHSGLVPVTGVNFYIDGVQVGSTQTGQTSYSVSLNASGQTPGAHTLKVQAQGNGCAFGGTGNFKSIPITTSANDNYDLNQKVA